MSRQTDLFDTLLDQLTVEQQLIVEEIFKRIRERLTAAQMLQILETSGAEGLIAALDIKDIDFFPLRDAIENSFYTGAAFQSTVLQATYRAAFNRRHQAAERWVLENGARAVREVSDKTKEGIRALVHDGLADGRSLGKIATGIRGVPSGGGTLGLTAAQSKFINGPNGLYSELPLDRPPSRAYFKRAARPKDLDRFVRQAIADKKPLPASMIERIGRRYESALVRRRAEVIARTEAHTALNAGKDQQMDQIAETLDDDEVIEGTWRSIKGSRTREAHALTSGQKRLKGQPYNVGGYAMMFPGDRSRGAPLRMTINCRCTQTYQIRKRRPDEYS